MSGEWLFTRLIMVMMVAGTLYCGWVFIRDAVPEIWKALGLLGPIRDLVVLAVVLGIAVRVFRISRRA